MSLQKLKILILGVHMFSLDGFRIIASTKNDAEIKTLVDANKAAARIAKIAVGTLSLVGMIASGWMLSTLVFVSAAAVIVLDDVRLMNLPDLRDDKNLIARANKAGAVVLRYVTVDGWVKLSDRF